MIRSRKTTTTDFNRSAEDLRPETGSETTLHINSSGSGPRISMNNGDMSGTLLEITTLYEKVRKGRGNEIYRLSKHGIPPARNLVPSAAKAAEDETIPMVPQFNVREGVTDSQDTRYLEFNQYSQLVIKKYLFFSAETGVIQSDELNELISFDGKDYTELFKMNFYWLNITDPNETDLALLFNSYNVHDFTLRDIRENDTEEKIEFYQHYTFMSTRLLREVKIFHRRKSSSSLSQIVLHSGDGQGARYRSNSPNDDGPTLNDIGDRDDGAIDMEAVDMDFNILIFKNFAITMHDKKWTSVNDILGFLNVLCQETILTPDWVLYSLFIELAQDAEYLLGRIEPRLNEVRLGSTTNLKEMSKVLHENYEMEFQLYTVQRFIKPKVNTLRTIKVKCGKRFGKTLLGLLNEIREDFVEMYNDLRNFNHILERSQDTFLALVSVEKSREANEMTQGMNRISLVALVFLPLTAISGFFGMNVEVPWQNDRVEERTTMYFWIIVLVSAFAPISLYFVYILIVKLFNRSSCIKRRKQPDPTEQSTALLDERRRKMSRSRIRV